MEGIVLCPPPGFASKDRNLTCFDIKKKKNSISVGKMANLYKENLSSQNSCSFVESLALL